MTTPTAGIAMTAAADAAEEQKQLWIASQFIGLVFRRVPVAAALNIVNAGILVFVLRDAVNAPLRFTWLGLIVAAMAVRVLLWRQYERADPGPGETPRWSRRFTASMAAAGLLWGAAAILFFVPGEPALQAYLAVAVGGMAAGALISVGAYPPAYRAFCLPVVFPLAVRFIFHGNETLLVTGFLIAAFGIVLLLVSDTLHRDRADFFALRADNADLVGILSTAAKAAKSAELAKAAFLGGISHELRTPLNAVIGFSEILKDEIFGSLGQPQYRDYAKLIHDSADQLLDVINEIIDIADAASGRLEINDESVDLPRLAASCADLIAARAGANAPRIATDFRCGLPNLRADARRIRKILLNLLSNAVKFTPPQGRIDIVAGPDDSGGVLLVVRDTGVGMEAGDAARATEPFGRGNVWLARRSAGAGVGLPLAKALVELHGGTLSVESAPGQGTSVTVRFPKERSLPRGEAG